MPRPRKPTALHRLSGAIEHDPQRFRDRADEPEDDRPLGDPPMHLSAPERVAWAEIERIAPYGVLRHADRLAVELLASHLAVFRALGASTSDAKVRRLESLLGQLGLTPATRSRVVAMKAPLSGNPFAANGRAPKAKR